MGRKIDLIGKKFGKLEVLEELSARRGKKIMWKCQCDCGNSTAVDGSKLRNGYTKSCGCLKHRPAHNRTHNMTGTRIYNIWANMKDRCHREKNKSYKNYGGRGIEVCDRWLNSFENFYEDMGPTYKEHLTIERIDYNGAYCPENCKWITKEEQSRNTRKNIIVEFNGEIVIISQLAMHTSVNIRTLYKRIARGVPVERAIDPTPFKSGPKSQN